MQSYALDSYLGYDYNMSIPYTYEQQLAGEVGHREYYAQFITPEITTYPLSRIKKCRMVRSQAYHFTDITKQFEQAAKSMPYEIIPLQMREDLEAYSCKANDNNRFSYVALG